MYMRSCDMNIVQLYYCPHYTTSTIVALIIRVASLDIPHLFLLLTEAMRRER